jgi:signal transduction histidine kinase
MTNNATDLNLNVEPRLASKRPWRVRFRLWQRLVFLGSFSAGVIGLVVLNQVYLRSSLSAGRTAAYTLLFVIASSAPFVLSFLSHRNDHSESVDSPPARPLWLSPLVACLVLSIALAALGLTTYQLGTGFVLKTTEHRLHAIATLKASLVSSWIEERREGIGVWSTNLQLATELRDWRSSGTRESQSKVLDLMALLAQSLGYLQVGVRDAKTGELLLTTGKDEFSKQAKMKAVEAARSPAPVLEDFYQDGEEMYLGFFSPIALPGSFNKVVIHVGINPLRELFPLIEQHSGEGESTEVMLLQILEGAAVVLNDTQHPPYGSSQRQLSTQASQQMTVLRETDNGGFLKIRDDLNQEVLAYAQPVSGTPWLLVAKIDKSEAFTAFRRISLLVTSVTSILLFIGAWWWLESRRHADLERSYQLDRAEFDQRLTEASRRLVQVQEEERRRLAVELHDWTGGNLAAINLNLKSIAKSIHITNQEDQELMQESSALLADTITSVREICGELRPAVLDYAGLTQAIESRLKQFTRRTGIASRFEHERFVGRCTPEIETKLYRITQEALLNCAKHSSASQVLIHLSNDDGHTVLRIEDDGVGFALEELGREGRSIGLGLQSMRERAGFVGALFSLDSSPGKGTCIVVTV